MSCVDDIAGLNSWIVSSDYTLRVDRLHCTPELMALRTPLELTACIAPLNWRQWEHPLSWGPALCPWIVDSECSEHTPLNWVPALYPWTLGSEHSTRREKPLTKAEQHTTITRQPPHLLPTNSPYLPYTTPPQKTLTYNPFHIPPFQVPPVAKFLTSGDVIFNP